jgi:hypothetical protein
MEVEQMLKAMLDYLEMGGHSSKMEDFEPIYGLPRQSLDDWLARNQPLKKEYDKVLADRLQRTRSARSAR